MNDETYTPINNWRVVCGQCGQRAEAADRLTTAVELAQDAGWVVVEIRRQQCTLCPECAQKAGKREGEAQP